VSIISRNVSRALYVVVATGLVLGVAACSSPATAPSGSASPAYVSTYEAPAPVRVAPLLGTVVAADAATGPALSVKICNVQNCEPLTGMNQADVVFEELVEGGITRYVAIWQSNVPEVVAPVRSVRPMDPEIVSSFGGIVAYSGWGPQEVRNMILDTGLVNIIENDTNMFRLTTNVAPYNLALRAQQVIAENPGLAAPQQQFAYSASPELSSAGRDGTPTSSITTVFSNYSDNSWTYDAASSKYLRSQWGGPELDEAGNQIASTNVVVMRVEIVDFMTLPRTVMISSGEAWVSTGGKTIHGTWSKDSATSPIRLTDDYGMTIRLAPGNTWIEMPPGDGSVTLNP
jgi:hypothetical protein